MNLEGTGAVDEKCVRSEVCVALCACAHEKKRHTSSKERAAPTDTSNCLGGNAVCGRGDLGVKKVLTVKEI